MKRIGVLALVFLLGACLTEAKDCKFSPNKRFQNGLMMTYPPEKLIGRQAFQVLQAGFGFHEGDNEVILAVGFARDFGGNVTMDDETPLEFTFESGRTLRLKPNTATNTKRYWSHWSGPTIRAQYDVTREEVGFFQTGVLQTARISLRDKDGVIKTVEFKVSKGHNEDLQKNAACALAAIAGKE